MGEGRGSGWVGRAKRTGSRVGSWVRHAGGREGPGEGGPAADRGQGAQGGAPEVVFVAVVVGEEGQGRDGDGVKDPWRRWPWYGNEV